MFLSLALVGCESARQPQTPSQQRDTSPTLRKTTQVVDDIESLQRTMMGVFESPQWKAVLRAEAEDKVALEEQTKLLDARLDEIRGHIVANQWIEAEAKRVDIHWRPVLSRSSDNEVMSKQYDDKRLSLLALIARERK